MQELFNIWRRATPGKKKRATPERSKSPQESGRRRGAAKQCTALDARKGKDTKGRRRGKDTLKGASS